MINTAKGITKGQIHVLFNERLKTSGASVLPFSFTVTVTAGQTVDLQLSAHTGKIVKVQWGDGKETTVSYSGESFTSNTNIYTVAGTYTIKIADSDNLNRFRIDKPDYSVDIVGALPVNLTHIYFDGNSINWNHTGALPVNLTFIYFNGNSINWSYTGALPVNLTNIHLRGNSINWNHTGALPVNLKIITFDGNSINWNHTGALPVNLTFITFIGNSINWNHTGALPVNLTHIYFDGNSINWSYSAQAYKSTLRYFRYLPGMPGKWSSVMVDQVIKDLAASTMAGNVNIAGNNEARTSASDQDLVDLRANGATVTVNEY